MNKLAVETSTGPPGPAAVEARGVAKLFGSTPALVRADITVSPGTIYALVGPNGAGKTTLLRIVATALGPSAGTVRVHGLDVRDDALRIRERIDFLPSSGGVYHDLTAAENLRFAAAMRGLRPADAALQSALGRFGLAAVAGELARTFSTGMVRRLSLARLLVTRPLLALLDEPYAGLDEPGRELVDQLLQELRADGRTAVLATHERARIEGFADGMARVEGGVTVAATSSSDRERPVLAPGAVA